MAEKNVESSLAASGSANDDAPRWKQPIRMWFKTRRLAWDRAWPDKYSGWSRQPRPPDSDVVDIEIPVGPGADYSAMAPLANKIRSRNWSSLEDQLRALQEPCEHVLGLLFAGTHKGAGYRPLQYDRAFLVDRCRHRQEANLLVYDVGCLEPGVAGPAGSWRGLPLPPALDPQVNRATFATTYLASPFAITAIHHQGDEILGATAALFYSISTFKQEQKFIDEVRAGTPPPIAARCYKHVYWKCIDDVLNPPMLNYDVATVLSSDLRQLDSAEPYDMRYGTPRYPDEAERQLFSRIKALRQSRESPI